MSTGCDAGGLELCNGSGRGGTGDTVGCLGGVFEGASWGGCIGSRRKGLGKGALKTAGCVGLFGMICSFAERWLMRALAGAGHGKRECVLL